MAPVICSDKPRHRDECSNTLSKNKAQSKPLDQFHYFPRLPPELRIIIWGMALRPCGIRGVHYFSLFNSSKEHPLWDLSIANRWHSKSGKVYGELLGNLLNTEHRIAAPRVVAHGDPSQPQPQHSWFKGNPSLYAWDAGLFNACRESRRIIVTKSLKRSRLNWDGWVIEGRHDEGGKIMPLRGHSYHDLHCFQFDRGLVEASKYLRWSVLLSQLPFNHLSLCPSNIAFEFDPTWLVSLPEGGDLVNYLHNEPSPRGLVARLLDAWHHSEVPSYIQIWLIDRSIRVSREIEARMRYHPRTTFSDLRETYVSVKRQDIFRDLGPKMERDSVFYLCRRFADWETSINRMPWRNSLGVLACLPRENVDNDES